MYSFAKERNVLAFFYVLCKIMLHSLRSFGFHKLPKTQKKNIKGGKRMEPSERKRMLYPTLPKSLIDLL